MDQTVPAYAAEVADYGRSRDPEPGEGALVKNVRPESPAWDVGIEPGMRVLTVNGEQLTDMIVWLWEADDDTVDLEVRERLRVLLYDDAPQGRPLNALYSR